MADVSDARVWARRAMLSALAGGGLTAIGLGGPFTGGALAAEAPNGVGGSQPSAPNNSAPGDSTQGQGQGSTTPTTPTSTTGSSTPAPASTAPASTVPTTTVPTSTAPIGPPQHPQSPATGAQDTPEVVAQHTQRASQSESAPSSANTPKPPAALRTTSSANIAPAPQLAAGAPSGLALLPTPSDAFSRALSFYRIPLFLLPIYQAASAQYGVPWEILAAINEVETNYGSDLSVSTAGAVGWMQFMPETWLQYGVDALGAGYADPYNPVDAIFAAARYLSAAGAQADLHTAIFAYNHSEAYVESVLLRARLIASYPTSVIQTLTGLTEGSLPVAGAQFAPNTSPGLPSGPSSATAGVSAQAAALPSQPAQAVQTARAASVPSVLPGSAPAPSPTASAAGVERTLNAPAPPSQLTPLQGSRNAPVLAVEDGRIVALGHSRKLGSYLVLRDTYGDVFTYAGLGSIAPFYRLPKPAQLSVPKGALDGGGAGKEPTPKAPATAGRQLPLTLHVARKLPGPGGAGTRSGSPGDSGRPGLPSAPAGVGKVRVFAHPGNPDALAAVHARAAAARAAAVAAGWSQLRSGSLVAQGTVLGHLGSFGEAPSAYLRFAIRPFGSASAIDPQPILENWRQLDAALHPKGAKVGTVLAGATAKDAFGLSAGELERAVLTDPGISLSACDRRQVAAGRVDSRALAVLVFLSRSGLKPTVGRLRCGRSAFTARGIVSAYYPSGTIDLTSVNGIPISGHQGEGTITDITIRTLLTIERRFAPRRIVSLMTYPNAPTTAAKSDHGEYIEIELAPRTAFGASGFAARAATAHPVAAAQSSSARTGISTGLSAAQWRRLITRVAGLPQPRVSRTPSSASIRMLGR